MTTVQSNFENPTGTVESMSATQPVAERRAMTADAKRRAMAALHRLIRATIAKRVNPSDTRVGLLNALFLNRIDALAKKLAVPVAQPANANTSGTSRYYEG